MWSYLLMSNIIGLEQVTRIMAADITQPYDVLGMNHKMAFDNMKKRYLNDSIFMSY